MNDEVCLEKHKRADERLDINEKRLNNHADRINKLEQGQSEFKIEIKNLCDNLKTLTNTLKWFMGI